MKSIDYWSAICYYIVFSALVEYCCVLYLKECKARPAKVGIVLP